MKRNILILCLLAFFVRLAVAPLKWHPDLNNHVDWGIKFFEYGINKFYAPESNVWAFTWPNQPPGTILIFAFIRKIYETMFNLLWQINTFLPAFPSGVITWMSQYLYPLLLKLPAIIADFGIAFLIHKIVSLLTKNKKAGILGAMLFLFNPVVWYNSAVWGQSDSTINFFALLSLYLIFTKKPVQASLAFAVCLFIKISLAIFLPLLLVLFIKQKYSTKEVLLAIALPLLLIFFVTIPFSDGKEPISWLISLYREKVLTNQMQVITANAFNLWAALTGIYEQPHSQIVGFLSYQSWGNILFLVSFLPLLYNLWKKPTLKTAIWAFALASFSSWMLLTNMHERYLYPLFPYLTILVALNFKMLPVYIIISVVNLLNLYHLWWWPEIAIIKNVMSMSNRVMARILGVINFVMYIIFYFQFIKIRNEKN